MLSKRRPSLPDGAGRGRLVAAGVLVRGRARPDRQAMRTQYPSRSPAIRSSSDSGRTWRAISRAIPSFDEMNDLIDFLFVAKEEDAGFSLKGRTLPALLRRMEEWHRALRSSRRSAAAAGRATQSPTPRTRPARSTEAIWRFRQIKTGNDLFREGQRMHHCVASYKFLCTRGDVSIWSLTCEYPIGHQQRRHHRAAQGRRHRAMPRLCQPAAPCQRSGDGEALGARAGVELAGTGTVEHGLSRSPHAH